MGRTPQWRVGADHRDGPALSDQLRRAGQRRRPVGPACCGDDRRVSEGAHSIATAGSRQLFFSDLGGAARFGPDVEWVDRIDFNVDARRAQLFYPSIRAYWPQLPDGALQPAYAGIRPKLSGPGEPPHDFVIDGPGQHGLPGLIQLFGFESPGLTSSLAVGQRVSQQALSL